MEILSSTIYHSGKKWKRKKCPNYGKSILGDQFQGLPQSPLGQFLVRFLKQDGPADLDGKNITEPSISLVCSIPRSLQVVS
jgi:hypothetical protein